MNAICLVVDRLHIGQIGAYGNAWAETPALDRLAFESFVFDQALAPSPRPEEFCRSVWQGRHPMLGRPEQPAPVDFARRLAELGVATTLATDDPTLAGDPMVGAFDHVIELDAPQQIEPADEVDQTHLAQCFAQVIDWLGSADGPYAIWVHLSSLGTCWDAPYEFRERRTEPGDPAPPHSAEAPSLMLDEDYDPDALLGIVQSYAGQVSLLDVCLGALLESIDEGPSAAETLLAIVASRGFPLGEHRRVGGFDEVLHGELVHVPMMVRLPDGLGAARRSQALVTPADLRATLLDWWSADDVPDASIGKSLLPIIRGTAETVRDRLLLGTPGDEWAIRTPAWYMRLVDPPRLYVKPDDRWEINDVADRCEPVVEELQAVAEDARSCLASGRADAVEPISEILRAGLE